MELYNLDKLIKVKVNDFFPSIWYEYLPERNIFGHITRKEGIYKQIYGTYLGMNCPKNHTFINGQIMENPEVVLKYEGNIEKTYYFNNYEDAIKFAKEITKNMKLIS